MQRVALAALAVAGLVLLILAGRPLATDDLWWHLAFGEMYAHEGLWPAAEPMLHTGGAQKPIQHEWLFQLGLHGLNRAFGFFGLRVFHALAVAGILALAFSTFRRASRSIAPAALATLVFVVVSWYRLFQLRPELFSIAALFLLYRLLLEPDRPPSWRRVAAAVGLLWVWANAHSMFAIGLALLVAALLGIALQALLAGVLVGARDPGVGARARRLAAALGAGGLATLLNPRGAEQHLHFFTEAGAGSIWAIRDDFLPFDPFAPPGSGRALTDLAWGTMDALLLAFAAVVVAGSWRLLRRRSAAALADLDAAHLGLGAAAIVAILTAIRFHWMAAFPLLFLLGAVRRYEVARGVVSGRIAAAAAAASVALALVFPSAIGLRSYAAEVALESDGYWRSAYLDRRYCGPGTRFLLETGLEGNLFNPFNLGGFLGYWLAPQLRTFVDGRVDHYPRAVLGEYQRIMRAGRSGPARTLRELLEEHRVDVFFGVSFPGDRYANRDAVAHLRRLPEWMLVYASIDHSIYLLRHSRNRQNLERVVAYYRRHGIPFDPERGLDVHAAIRDAPEWAARQNLIPPDLERLEADRAGDDPEARLHALRRLGELYSRIGDTPSHVEVDRERLELEPGAKEPRRRLAEGLLRLGETRAALRVARGLFLEDPGYGDIAYLYAVAEQLERNQRFERRQLEREASRGTSPASP